MPRGKRRLEEVSKDEFDKYLKEHNDGPFDFDGMRYTFKVEMRGVTWQKPVAAVMSDKYYLIHDD